MIAPAGTSGPAAIAHRRRRPSGRSHALSTRAKGSPPGGTAMVSAGESPNEPERLVAPGAVAAGGVAACAFEPCAAARAAARPARRHTTAIPHRSSSPIAPERICRPGLPSTANRHCGPGSLPANRASGGCKARGGAACLAASAVEDIGFGRTKAAGRCVVPADRLCRSMVAAEESRPGRMAGKPGSPGARGARGVRGERGPDAGTGGATPARGARGDAGRAGQAGTRAQSAASGTSLERTSAACRRWSGDSKSRSGSASRAYSSTRPSRRR